MSICQDTYALFLIRRKSFFHFIDYFHSFQLKAMLLKQSVMNKGIMYTFAYINFLIKMAEGTTIMPFYALVATLQRHIIS